MKSHRGKYSNDWFNAMLSRARCPQHRRTSSCFDGVCPRHRPDQYTRVAKHRVDSLR